MSNQTVQAQKKPRLGRGLGSLLGAAIEATAAQPPVPQQAPFQSAAAEGNSQPTTVPPVRTTQPNQTQPQAAPPPEARIWKIAIDKLHPNEYQPRQKFNKETIQELASSIKSNGILQPIVARRHPTGALEIISGERRWRAAQAAGLHEVPVILKNVNDQESLELAIIENIQREDLNPVDEAEAYRRLVNEFSLTQQQVAEKVGKDRATVANAMRILNLPKDLLSLVSSGELSVGHAKTLLSIENQEAQRALAQEALKRKLSVRALEKLISNAAEVEESRPIVEDHKSAVHIKAAESAIQKSLGNKVSIDYRGGKGKISIHFHSIEALNELIEKLSSL